MAHRRQSHYTSHNNHDRTQRLAYSPKYTEQLDLPMHHYSTPTDSEGAIRSQSSRRRRWAAGYIDRRSCPSYPYITARSRSPDEGSDYITHQRVRGDDYVEPRDYDTHTYSHATHKSNPRPSRAQGCSSKGDCRDGYRCIDAGETRYGSDVEDIDEYRDSYRQDVRSRRCDSEEGEGSDVVSTKRRSVGSDVASIRSRSECEGSDRRSIRSLGLGSDVRVKRGGSGSDSDSEGGYISLDDYVADRSDCASDMSLSEDDGEGSDGIGSDIEEERDVADASDVASVSDAGDYDDGEDCINEGYEDYDNY